MFDFSGGPDIGRRDGGGGGGGLPMPIGGIKNAGDPREGMGPQPQQWVATCHSK